MTTVRHIDEDLFADETCDYQCIVIGEDKIHRCLDAIVRAYPDGCSLGRIAFYLGLKPLAVYATVQCSLAKLPHRIREELGDACDAA